MSLKREIARSNIVTTGSRFISYFVVFVFNVVLARMLGPEGFGAYSFFLVVATFFSLFTDFGMTNVAVRFLSNFHQKQQYGKLRTLLRLFLGYRLLLTLLAAALLILLHQYIAQYVFAKPDLSSLVLFAAPLVLFMSLSSSLFQVLSAFKDFVAASFYTLAENLLRLVIVLGLVWLGFGAPGAVWGTTVSYVLLFFFISILLLKRHGKLLSAKAEDIDRRAISKFAFWFVIFSITTTVYSHVDQLIIASLLPVDELGFYRVAVSWALAVAGLIPITTFVMYPYLSSAASADSAKRILHQSLRYMAIFVFPAAALLSLMSVPIVSIFYGRAYLPAAQPLSILSFMVISIAIMNILYPYYWALNRPQTVTKISAFYMIVAVVALFPAIRIYGLMGAALVIVMARILEMATLLLLEDGLDRLRVLVHPLLASLAVYLVGQFFYVNTLVEMAVVGAALSVLYLGLMFITRGLTKEDIKSVLDALRP